MLILIIIIILIIISSITLSVVKLVNNKDNKPVKNPNMCKTCKLLTNGLSSCDYSLCSPLYCQCGGNDFKGNTTCCDGAVCVKQNDYYSQCSAKEDSTCIQLHNYCANTSNKCCSNYICNPKTNLCDLPGPKPKPKPKPNTY